MQGRTHRTHTRVRFGETDAAGIVFYPTFFAWFDLGVQGLLHAATGALSARGGRPRWPLPIVESGARFSAPLFFDDAIVIRTTVTELGRSSLRFEHAVLKDEVEVARGFEVRVFISAEGEGIASAPIPKELRAALAEETSSGCEVA